MRLKYQLFLIFLLMGGLLVALMTAFSSWSFDRGFIRYINDTERQLLKPLVQALAEGYEREGDWQWLSEDAAAWALLIERHTGLRKAGRNQRGREPANNPARALTLDPRLLLANAAQELLIGREAGNRTVHWQAVSVDDTHVGYLGHRQRDTLPAGLDQAFARQQRRSFLLLALAVALLCVPAAVLLANQVVNPVMKIKDAVRHIGRGDYAHRVPDTRKDELGELSRSINGLAGTLEKNLNARRQWLAEISHELRTPVAILRGELESLQDGIKPLDDTAIASLHAETLRLGGLINDLHDLTLSDAGALNYRFDPVTLDEVIKDRIAASSSQLHSAGLTLTFNPSLTPLTVEADAQRIGQLVDNLLQNSIRYTDSGGEIQVALTQQDGTVQIDWLDSGPGVDDDQLDRLFDPLYRVDASRSRAAGGSGLGLSIVQRIVDAHQGQITAAHSTLGGVCIRIELPRIRHTHS
jgi:two-component system sensor histidine kinase BaeS